MDKGQWNTETPSPYMPWNNSQVGKNPVAETWIELGTSWLVGNDVTTEPSSWIVIIH